MRASLLFVALTLAAAAAGASPRTDKVIENVRLPTGFKMEVYSDQVPGARSMALGQKGTLFVGTRARGGKVYAVSGTPGNGAKPTVRASVAIASSRALSRTTVSPERSDSPGGAGSTGVFNSVFDSTPRVAGSIRKTRAGLSSPASTQSRPFFQPSSTGGEKSAS